MSDFDPFGDAGARRAPAGTSAPATRGDPWPEPGTAAHVTNVGTAFEGSDAASPHGRVLVICTGNVCRSPYIDLRLQAALADTGIEVHSAGTGALVDAPVDLNSARLLTERGIDPSAFRARQLEPDMVRRSDLVLTATRDHRAETVRIARTGLDRTFALVDFAGLINGVTAGELERAKGVNACQRLVAVAVARRVHAHALVDGGDIRDPFRKPFAEFQAMQAETDPSLDAVAAALRLAADVVG